MRKAWLAAGIALAGCHQGAPQQEHAANADPINAPARPAAAVTPAPSPAVPAIAPPSAGPVAQHFVATGTEPFWSADVAAGSLRYSTPENQSGAAATVTEAKDGTGVRYSGTLGGQAIDLLIQPGKCSDGMSGKTYAYSAKLLLGTSTARGCAERK